MNAICYVNDMRTSKLQRGEKWTPPGGLTNSPTVLSSGRQRFPVRRTQRKVSQTQRYSGNYDSDFFFFPESFLLNVTRKD